MLSKFTRISTPLLLLMMTLTPAVADIDTFQSMPAKRTVEATAPSINAKASILLDANSGKVIAEENANERMQPASLTKMMTMYVVSDALHNGSINLTDNVKISKKAWQTGGSKMFLKEGASVSVDDLIHGIIIVSGNDASVAMAELISGSEDGFVDLMNDHARALGMNDTHFENSTGLPHKNHFTTAHDMAVLGRALISHFPNDYKLYSKKWFTYNEIKQPNRNRLLWRNDFIDGIKTGHTDDAGFCLVASGQKDDMRLVSVLMGAPDDQKRINDSHKLLNFGFKHFETHKVYAANDSIGNARVYYGRKKEITAGIAEDLFITIPRDKFNNLKAKLEFKQPLKAPITKGQTLGELKILLGDNEISSKPLLALSDDPKGGFIKRFFDYVRLLFKRFA